MTSDKTWSKLYQAIVIIVHEPHTVSFVCFSLLILMTAKCPHFSLPLETIFIILFFGIATVKLIEVARFIVLERVMMNTYEMMRFLCPP